MSSGEITGLPMATSADLGLAIAELAIYILMLPPVLWTTWKHGKSGMVCWPIFVSYFGMRFAADIHQIQNHNGPLIPDLVVSMTNAGSIACLSLTLIGMVYEANIILPLPPKRWTEKIILGITHLANTGGIAVAMYGASPNRETGGLLRPSFAQIGNCMMLFVLFGISYWLWPTYKRIRAFRHHPNARPAMWLIRGAAVGIPFQLVRLAYSTLYAFNPVVKWNPVSGTRAMRVIFMFLAQLGVAAAATAAGWMSRDVLQKKQLPEGDCLEAGPEDTPWREGIRSESAPSRNGIPLDGYGSGSAGRKMEPLLTGSHRYSSS